MLYLNVGGLTNMAIAEGKLCRFTRVVGGGLEAMASEIAERRGIPLVEARALLAEFDLPRPGAQLRRMPPPPSAPSPSPAPVAPVLPDPEAVETWALAQDPTAAHPGGVRGWRRDCALDPSRPSRAPAGTARCPRPRRCQRRAVDPEVRMVLENGIREIVGEVRNSLDFHRSQEGGGEVSSVVLSGPALEMTRLRGGA